MLATNRVFEWLVVDGIFRWLVRDKAFKGARMAGPSKARVQGRVFHFLSCKKVIRAP